MSKLSPYSLKLKVLFSLALMICFLLLPPSASQAAKGKNAQSGENYVVYPGAYRDNYILTQVFYSAFSVENLPAMQHVVSQGMLAYPNDFPRFMALTLELVKTPDSRLFMLLSPLAPYMAGQAEAADLATVMNVADILSGQRAPGGAGGQSLLGRIKYYEDNSRTVSPNSEDKQQFSAGAAEETLPEAEGGGEKFNFIRNAGGDILSGTVWTRSGQGGQSITSRAVDSLLPDEAIWGGVYTNSSGNREVGLAFFVVRGGIISFALPGDINESNFYADELPRPHQSDNLDPAIFAGRADGAVPRPCEMRIVIAQRDDSLPPELVVHLEQSNAGREKSDFICKPQCVLGYSWGDDGYYLSGKSCVQSGWGVWPHGDERGAQRKPATPRQAQ